MSESLVLDGEVARPLSLSFEQLTALPEGDQIHDVSRFHPSRRGDAVSLESLLRLAEPNTQANYLTLHAEKDDFHVSVPLAPLREQGMIVYANGGRPLGPGDHGPFRFLVRDPLACNTGELDECANVKYLTRIELTSRKGRDTRPTDEAEHAALHAAEDSPD
jgi:DMSO/TMAO reductase YedYZ molybdopterin-dependent catalytic subunit